MDADTGQLHVFPAQIGVPWCSHAAGVAAGPRVVQQCTLANRDSTIRFLDVEGRAMPEWTFPGSIYLLQVSPDGKMLAIIDTRDKTRLAYPHEIVLLNIADRSEARRWLLPEVTSYNGTFAIGGTEFCTVANPATVSAHEIECRNVKTGELTYKKALPHGPVRLGAAGDALIVSRSEVVMLPFRLFDTDFVFTGAHQTVLSPRTGQILAQWRTPPMNDVNFASAVSEDGERVALANSAMLRVYRVIQ